MRKLLFIEEFKGNKLNENYWNVYVGNRCANNELQAYTDQNYKVNNGLTITGRCENLMDREFTSTKITTRNKFSFKKGLVEIVAKLPAAVGSWPAFWMMPEDMTGGWPTCGEIDILEHCGHKLDKAFFSIHVKDFNHMYGNGFTKTVKYEGITKDFHKYSFLWKDEKLTWLVDDEIAYELHKNQVKGEENWPFNKEYYLILNMAIGGNFCEGYLNKEDFPCNYEIKSIKVYGEEL